MIALWFRQKIPGRKRYPWHLVAPGTAAFLCHPLVDIKIRRSVFMFDPPLEEPRCHHCIVKAAAMLQAAAQAPVERRS